MAAIPRGTTSAGSTGDAGQALEGDARADDGEQGKGGVAEGDGQHPEVLRIIPGFAPNPRRHGGLQRQTACVTITAWIKERSRRSVGDAQ